MGEELPEPKPLSSHDKRELKKQQKQTQSQQQSSVAIDTNKKRRTKVYIITAIIIIAAAFALWKIPGGITATTAVEIGDHQTVGLASSSVQFVVFGDFQCPFTRRFWDGAFPKVLEEYKDKIQVVYWPVPTSKHNYDRESAEAAYCAGDQGQFWEYANILFQRQGAALDADLRDYARELDLDVSEFSLCFASGKYKGKVASDYKEGRKLGVVQTPTVAVNEHWLSGNLPFEEYRTFIEYELKNG